MQPINPPALPASRRIEAVAVLAALLFLALTLWNLDRYPPVHFDEPHIRAPGYNLFTKGVYGSDLFGALLGMDKHCLGFMPLMPLLEGAAARVLGLGVWQMRIVAALSGALTLLVSVGLAKELAGSSAAVVTMALLLFWQWTPGGPDFLKSGVPLVDLSRVARYDILTAPLGLIAFRCFIRAPHDSSPVHHLPAGFFAGLAGLAHLYGLFWIPAFLLFLVLDRLYFSGRAFFPPFSPSSP